MNYTYYLQKDQTHYEYVHDYTTVDAYKNNNSIIHSILALASSKSTVSTYSFIRYTTVMRHGLKYADLIHGLTKDICNACYT